VPDFALHSSAFDHGGPIPRRHGCEGEDLSPPLSWSGAPEGTRSLALVVDDPDAPAGTFTHWLAWALDPGAKGLRDGETAPGEGRDDFGTSGYRGPCPPPGHGRQIVIVGGVAIAPARQQDSGCRNGLKDFAVTRSPWTARRAAARRRCRDLAAAFDIRTPSLDTSVRQLSGENQQKIVLARELGPGPRLQSPLSRRAGSTWGDGVRLRAPRRVQAVGGATLL
jgi:Raf kinase inhibitor-like YbhB/YbcL family protein